MNKLDKIVSWLALVVSLTTIGLYIFNVLPYSVIDSNTFISTIVALIGVMVTLLVGYQILEAVEINKKLEKIEELQKQEEMMQSKLVEDEQQTRMEFENRRIEMEEQRCMLLYEVHKASGNSLDSFLRLHEALQFGLSTETLKLGMSQYYICLEKAMLKLDNAFFETRFDKPDIEGLVNGIKAGIEKNDLAIRGHENYYVVMDRYEDLMNKFYVRLDNIAIGKKVSSDEIDK